MDMEKNKLPVLATLHKSIATIADKSFTLFKALLLPSIIIWIVFLGQRLMQQHVLAMNNDGVNISKIGLLYLTVSNVGVFIIHVIFSAVLAVICHRAILLGKESLPSNFGIYFSRRELKYFGWLILFSIPIGIGSIVIPSLSALSNSMDSNEAITLLKRAWSIVGTVIASFIIAPFVLVLPATAVDEERPFSKARLTVRGNTIRLAVVLIIPTLIGILTVWALAYFGPENYNIAYNVFIGLIVVVFMVFEAAALAVSYKTLAYDRKNT